MKYFVLIFCLCVTTQCFSIPPENSLRLISVASTPPLHLYDGYSKVAIKLLEIPEEIKFASLKFEQIQKPRKTKSNPNCSLENVMIVLSPRSLPIILTENSDFPKTFKNVSRTGQIHLNFTSEESYLNLTSPEPGSYFFAAFLENKSRSFECSTYVKASVFIQYHLATEISERTTYNDNIFQYEPLLYKFFVPRGVSYVSVNLTGIASSKTPRHWYVDVTPRRQSFCNHQVRIKVNINSTCPLVMSFPVEEQAWNYLQLFYANKYMWGYVESATKFSLQLRYSHWSNGTRIFDEKRLNHVTEYKELELLRESSNRMLDFSYHLPPNDTITLAEWEMVVLKFQILDRTDIGTALRFSLSYDDENYKVVGCLRPGAPELPTWCGGCRFNGENRVPSILLRKSKKKDVVMVPYPEAGMWYASFRLFPRKCTACPCQLHCQKIFQRCLQLCRKLCIKEGDCGYCPRACKSQVNSLKRCSKCDCHGPCAYQKTNNKTTIAFNLSAQLCANNCGYYGSCHSTVADGVVLGTCACSYGYKGWDCWDGKSASFPYAANIAEILLLVLSNLIFLPTVFVAFRRRYYPEAVAYLAVFFFSSFYHACDADTLQRKIHYCITRLNTLQFADFYSAVMAIWVTLIAVADLKLRWRAVLYVTGAVVFAFIVAIKPTGFWANALPPFMGAVLIAASWLRKWRKMGCGFVDKRYVFLQLPLGVTCVLLGLVFFWILVTADNYVYFHSLWHCIMAGVIIIALPKKNTFKRDEAIITNRESQEEFDEI